MRGTEQPDGFSASNSQTIGDRGGAGGQTFSMQCKLNREEMCMLTDKLTPVTGQENVCVFVQAFAC